MLALQARKGLFPGWRTRAEERSSLWRAKPSRDGRCWSFEIKILTTEDTGRHRGYKLAALALVSGNNRGLDVAVAVQHVPQYVMQARERSFARDVVRAANFSLGDQSECTADSLRSVMERGF